MTKPANARWPELVIDVGRLIRRDNLADLKRRPADRPQAIEVAETVQASGLTVSTAGVPDGSDVVVSASLRPTMRGIEARVRATSSWEGECRRCLDPVVSPIEIDIMIPFLSDFDPDGEVSADDAEAYPIKDNRVDLGEALREELMLALPLSPLCEEECTGADPDRFPTSKEDEGAESGEDDGEPEIDPRWAGLSALTFDEE